MSANFRSNNNDIWKLNKFNLLLTRSELIKKQNKLEVEIKPKNSYKNIASMLVEPSDYNDLPAESRLIYVGKNGLLSFLTENNKVKTIKVVRDCSLFEIKTYRILFTSTSASSIIVLF